VGSAARRCAPTPLLRKKPARSSRSCSAISWARPRWGERIDAELLREVLDRYFATMRAVLESHGGIIEKYIGDAIMAVFGLPRAHEDDALRAVAAARAMGARLQELNAELERRWGAALTNRIGVNTGR
jgi:class 3 adenylate cyclase